MSNQRSTATVALAVLVAVALSVGAYFLLYSPILEAKAEADAEAERIEGQNQDAEAELRKLAKEQAELPERQADLAKQRNKFPTDMQLARFTEYLSALANQTKAVVKVVEPGDPVQLIAALPLPVGPGDRQAPTVAQPPSSLYQYPFTIEIEGTWPQADAYLKLLQGADARMFLVTSVGADAVIASGSGGFGAGNTVDSPFRFTVKGYTYALIPPDQVPDTADEGG
jgi:hypothetical protein